MERETFDCCWKRNWINLKTKNGMKKQTIINPKILKKNCLRRWTNNFVAIDDRKELKDFRKQLPAEFLSDASEGLQPV